MVINIADKTEQRHNGDVRVTPVQNLVRIVGNQNPSLHAETCKIADVHTDNIGIHIDRTYDLRAMFIEIPQRVLCHLTATILHNFDLIHKTTSFVFLSLFFTGILINYSLYSQPTGESSD